jgi:hypothetical protein
VTFTYTLSTQIGQVRFRLQDTTEPALLTDEEITLCLTDEGSVAGAAAAGAEAIAHRYAHGLNFKSDDQEFDAGDRAKQWAELATKLRRQAGGTASLVLTKVDGYSQDIPADQVSTGTASRTGRRNWYTNQDRVY